MGRDTIIERRSDMSSYLIHWTTGNAFNAIICSGFLIPGRAERWHDVSTSEEGKDFTIYGGPAVCFSEMPIGNWIQSITAYGGYSDKRWGIAIPKQILYAYGARPVLYVSKKIDPVWGTCPAEEQFRLNNFKYTLGLDWSHEREWRVCANPEFNAKIGLNSDKFKHLSGDSLVPVHLPDFDPRMGELDTALPDNPHFVIIVETEKDKDKVRQSPSPAIFWNRRYSSISAYRDKYLEALQRAKIVSLEYAREARDRANIWTLEDLISNQQRPQYIVILWDKAKTETRRQVLRLILTEKELKEGYEYYSGCDLWSTGTISTKSVGARVEECEQAIGMLKKDVRDWLYESFVDTLNEQQFEEETMKIQEIQNRKRWLTHKSVLVFYDDDFFNMASHCPQSECGFSVYQGVLIQWDEDQDDRVLEFVDNLKDYERAELAIVQEHEGTIAMLWRRAVPSGYEEGNDVEVGNDVWKIVKSMAMAIGLQEERDEY